MNVQKIRKKNNTQNALHRQSKKTYSKPLVLLFIIITGFIIGTNIFYNFTPRIRLFSTALISNRARANENITFNFQFLGEPERLILIYGDGQIEAIEDIYSIGTTHNSIYSANFIHSYALQGVYTPKIFVYYQDFIHSKSLSKSIDLLVKNNAPQFDILIGGVSISNNGLRTSDAPDIFEGEEVTVSITNLEDGFSYDNLIFDFADSQISTNETSVVNSFDKSGFYTISVTAIGSCGELTKKNAYIEIKNKPPEAFFELEKDTYSVGEVIKLNGLKSKDTKNDEHLLSFYYEWGDGTNSYGKNVKHSYSNPGVYTITFFVKDDDADIDSCSRTITVEGDPEIYEEYDPVEVEEIVQAPSLSITDASIVANASFEVYRENLADEAIFSMLLLANGEPQHGQFINSSSSVDNLMTVSFGVLPLSLSKDWTVVFNSTELPDSGASSYEAIARFHFLDDQELVVTSGVIDGGMGSRTDYAEDLDLKGTSNYALKYPISFESSIFDPSADDITLSSTYIANMLLEIDCTDALPITDSFIVAQPNGNALYNVEVTDQSGIIQANISIQQVLSPKIFENNLLPINIESNIDILPIVDIMDILETRLGLSDLTVLGCIEANNWLNTIVTDDDGSTEGITAFETINVITIENLSPKLDLIEPEQVLVQNEEELVVKVSDFNGSDFSGCNMSLEIGNGSISELMEFDYSNQGIARFKVIHTFYKEGEHLMVVKATSEFGMTTIKGLIINVNRKEPYVSIDYFIPRAVEGKGVQFTSTINYHGLSSDDYKVKWDFGDGSGSLELHPKHSFSQAGQYNVTLQVIDKYGNVFSDMESIIISEQAPEIKGPYSFVGVDSQLIELNVEIYDSDMDECIGLSYEWLDSDDMLISTQKKPLLILGAGSYVYTLKVTDPSGLSSSEDISVAVHPIAPEIFTSSYMYHGKSGGEVEITVFGFDAGEEHENLKFYWRIFDGNDKTEIKHYSGAPTSTITVTCTETTIYTGEVTVIDALGRSKTNSFHVISKITEDEEAMISKIEDGTLRMASENDYDNDNLNNTYELTISNTSIYDPDTDGDGLFDGYSTETGVGEQTLGTDPLDYDSDNDGLSDGFEVIGHNITIVYFEGSSCFAVDSNPLCNDTDGDSLSDYDEYIAGTHPRNNESDNDLLLDPNDPAPTKYDSDDDGLNDYYELYYGTNVNNSDTDGDGLSDGDEIYGWGNGFYTNPLNADSDHDFVGDAAEIMNYLVELQNVYQEDVRTVLSNNTLDLTDPEYQFSTAVAAELRFALTLGEYQNDTGEESGDYPATYSFADDFILGDPYGWDVDETGGTVNVIEELDDHKKVVELLDTSGSYAVNIYNNFSGQSSGTIELYVMVDSSSDIFDLYLWSGGVSGTIATIIRFRETGYIAIREPSGLTNIQSYSANKWYHIKIDFESDSGSYQGLSADSCYVYVEGVQYGPYTFWNGVDNIDTLFFDTESNYLDFSGYIDAIGYSWDPDYEIGDNLEEDRSYGYRDDEIPNLNVTVWHATENVLLFNATTNCSRYFSQAIDLTPILNNETYNYRGFYTIDVNGTSVDCSLEQFEIEVCRYLNASDPDTDGDGILDGVEMGLLVEGTDTIDFQDYYLYNNLTVSNIPEFNFINVLEYDEFDIYDGSITQNGTLEAIDGNCTVFESDQDELDFTSTINLGFNWSDDAHELELNMAFQTDAAAVVYYPFEEGSGTTTYDYSNDQDHDGTLYNMDSSDWVSGKVGDHAINTYDGNDFVYIQGYNLPNTLFSASAWGKTPYVERQWIVCEGKTGESVATNINGFGVYDSNEIFYWTETGGGTNHIYRFTVSGNPCDGNWHFLACKVVGTSLTMWFDGQKFTHSSIANTDTTANNCWVGSYQGTTGSGDKDWRGDIDDVRIWEHALSDEDVNLVYNGGNGRETKLQPAEISVYNYDNEEYDDFTGFCEETGVYCTLNVGLNGSHVSNLNDVKIRTEVDRDVTLYMDQFYLKPRLEYYIPEDDDEFDIVYLEIPQIGKVNDAELNLKIESEGVPIGNGYVEIELLKEEINCSIEDAVLFDSIEEFSNSSIFIFDKSLDLPDFLDNDSISEMYGAYFLKIAIFSPNATQENFTLSEFYIESDTHVQATKSDTEAWITDPALSDTDNDGWSDKYEIYDRSEPTNPLEKDTDGDGALDSADIDPLRDVILEFNPIKGQWEAIWPIFVHKLQMGWRFTRTGFPYVSDYCPSRHTHTNKWYRLFNEWIYIDAYFDHYKYYYDVDDGNQGNSVNIRFIGYCNDDWAVDGYFDYDITGMGNEEDLLLNGWDYLWGDADFRLRIKTVCINRSNTIAIYERNGTIFNGHYQEQETINIFRVHVTKYKANYNFETKEDMGEVPNGWTDASADDCFGEVKGSVGDHENVLWLHDGSTSDGASIYKEMDSFTNDIELWAYPDEDCDLKIQLYTESTNFLLVQFWESGDEIKYYDGTWHSFYTDYDEQWYHLRFAFNYDSNKFDLYLDGTKEVDEGTFLSSASSCTKIGFKTYTSPKGDVYIDAIGIIGMDGYEQGDNLEDNSLTDGTPFELGINYITIPTRLFTDTLLNGYVQTNTLNQTILYSDGEDHFEFIAVGRDGEFSEMAGSVDFVFIRDNIHADEAMELLELLTVCVVNETLDAQNNTIVENATLYAYQCRKSNGTEAVLMNLPTAALNYVQWDNNFENSLFGEKPVPFSFSIFLSILTALLAYIAWLVVRVVLLVLFFILLAVEIAIISIVVLSMGLPLLLMSSMAGISVSLKFNIFIPYAVNMLVGFLSFGVSNTDCKMEWEISWKYWSFFDLYVPWIISRTISGDTVIQEEEQNVLTGEASENFEELEPQPSMIETAPRLFESTFENKTVTCDSDFRFEVKYYDANFEEPEPDYGVRMHVIAPNGSVLEYHLMGSEVQNPDYSDPEGVVFNYTFDISGFEKGLWHYYITTKDNSTGDVVFYPENDYFIGPDTSDGPNLLMGYRVSNSESLYYNPEGWKSNEFDFYIDWWDIMNGTAPSNISLCLLPANISDGTGISNKVGIQKFEMQPTNSTPNFNNSVEYQCSVNFSSLGYADSELGLFHHYFEAITSDGKLFSNMDCNGENSSHIYGPFIKPTSMPIVKIESSSSSSSSSLITGETRLEYMLTFSDHTGNGLSETPEIIFSRGENEIRYNMTSVYNSSDNSEQRYYFALMGSELGSGTFNVDFKISYQGSYLEYQLYSTAITVINFFLDTYAAASATIGLLGILPMAGLIVAGGLSVSGNPHYALTVGLGTLLGVAIGGYNTFCGFLLQGEMGGVLGMAIGCLFTLIALKESPGWVKAMGWIYKHAAFVWELTSLVSFMSIFFTALFPGNDFVSGAVSFAANIFTAFPLLLGLVNTAYALNVMSGNALPIDVKVVFKEDTMKGFSSMVRTYKSLILMLGIFSFLAVLGNLYYGVYDYFAS